ncbi:hypothetical protein AAFC00_006745 [Neodothiora populina]|uniref:Uncharacterized protein n=1 Tax=Neodothiora populina TaxID=2781224 RepID=A0ABR3PB65_9PEZI
MSQQGAGSPDETPVPSTEPNPANAPSSPSLPEEEWTAMQDMLNYIYDYRTAGDYDPSKVFHRKVNKRAIPDYYDVIKEPIAMSTIKAKINNREYKHFTHFVRDFALISHNAQVYNRPNAGVYQDALTVRSLVEEQLKKLVDKKVITGDMAKIPYLGEIPAQDDLPMDEDEGDDDDDDDDDEGEEDDDDDDDGGKKKRRRASRATKGDRGTDKAEDHDTRRKRGRPPKVLTPTEARINAILKGLRKPRNQAGQMMINSFERLPDKAVMPEYFNEIKNPMAFDVLKRKMKRKKYQHLEQFIKDVHLMFENAKEYNLDDSQIYKDAVHLQEEAHRLAQEETAKPDSEYAMDEGRMPMPNGILHNGELYKVGDWVHIQNVNDLTKPIPCQIYRTWQDAEAGQFVNVCWYYRPEQTVHRFDKHFLENEVVKTGQYRDHRVDEIVDRCFIMFFTRYYKGRPRGLSPDKEVYVCQARYNEEKFKFNKIKTWASCLPDEVRDKDYEMDLFAVPRKMKKVPSPIAYLLKDTMTENDEPPKPAWGADNAPPKIGAVHKKPRDPQESPPPQPTPTPPPQTAPTPAMRQASLTRMSPHVAQSHSPMPMATSHTGASMPNVPTPAAARPAAMTRPSNTPAPQRYPQQSMSPAPALQRALSGQASNFNNAPSTPQQQLPTASLSRTAAHPSTYAANSSTAPTAPVGTPAQQTNHPIQPPRPTTSSYRDPAPIEVYTLPDVANASIPPSVRQQFEQDDQGRVLFFTAPPMYLAADDDKSAKNLAHSIRFLADRARRRDEIARKRKAYEDSKADAQKAAKRARLQDARSVAQKREESRQEALAALEEQLVEGARRRLRGAYGDAEWKKGLDKELDLLEAEQREALERRRLVEEHERDKAESRCVKLGSAGTLL